MRPDLLLVKDYVSSLSMPKRHTAPRSGTASPARARLLHAPRLPITEGHRPILTREVGTNFAIVILRRSAHPPLRREAFDRALLR